MVDKKVKLKKFFKVFNKIEDIILILLVIGMLTTILIQIVGRVVGKPIPWTEEVSRYLFLWMMFIALASGFNRVESSRVVMFVENLPKSLKIIVPIIYGFFVTLIFIFMIVYGGEVVKQQITLNEMGTAIKLPMYLVGLCQPVAGVLGLIGVFQSFIEYPEKIKLVEDNSSEFENEKEG